MGSPEYPRNYHYAPDTGQGDSGSTESAESQDPIRLQIGKAFRPLERFTIPDLPTSQLILEQPFNLEGVGQGCIRLAELVSVERSAHDSSPEIDFRMIEQYSNPFGELRITRNASPDHGIKQRWYKPLKLEHISLALNQPKVDVEPPALLLEFLDTHYRYWAVDTLVGPNRNLRPADEAKRGYNPNRALYYWWVSDADEIYTALAVNRDQGELAKIQVTFISQENLPGFSGRPLRPPRPYSGYVLSPPPLPKRRDISET